MTTTFTLTTPDGSDRGPWVRLAPSREVTRDFRFAFVSSTRAGLDPLGGLGASLQVARDLGADFVVQLGDAIPGYAESEEALHAQWDELDEVLASVDVPIFRAVGNHDVSDELARTVWVERYGASCYAVRVQDVLFLVLDTQDGATLDVDDFTVDVLARLHDDRGERIRAAVFAGGAIDASALHALAASAPDDYEHLLEVFSDVKAARGGDARIGVDQRRFAEQVLHAHADVRWTFLVMHIPAWAGEGSSDFDALLEVLGDRPWTALSGHVIHYRAHDRAGRELLSLGYTDPRVSATETRRDVLTWVAMSDDGPTISNLMLDAVLDSRLQARWVPGD